MSRTKSTTPEQKTIRYEDLPEKIRNEIDKLVEYRISLGLPDDSEERKERAIKYFVWEQEKKSGEK